MYDFFKKHTGKITISLVVVMLILMAIALTLVSSGVTTAVTCIAFITGGASLFTGAYYLGQVEAASEEQESNNNEEQEKDLEAGVMLDNKSREQLMNTYEMVSRREKPAQNNLSETSQKAHLTPSDFFCGFFRALDKQKKTNFLKQQLDEVSSGCVEQMRNENLDVKIINEALRNHSQEATFFLTKHSTYFSPVTEENPLSNSKNQPDCNRGLNELSELIGTYPKYSFYENSSLETLISFAEARQEHHERVLSVANEVLPDLRALLNEAKDRVATLQNINPS